MAHPRRNAYYLVMDHYLESRIAVRERLRDELAELDHGFLPNGVAVRATLETVVIMRHELRALDAELASEGIDA